MSSTKYSFIPVMQEAQQQADGMPRGFRGGMGGIPGTGGMPDLSGMMSDPEIAAAFQASRSQCVALVCEPELDFLG